MRVRRTFVVVLTTVATLVATATTAGAAAGPPIARYDMNEPAGARTMIDSSGHGLHGVIGGEVATGVSTAGSTGYRFGRLAPDTPPVHPRHLVIVTDSGLLDPGTRDYAVTVRLRTQYQFGNIIQKGQATVAGGNFKFQIPSGIVQCLFRGSPGTVIVQSSSRQNDGRWHTVRCERTTPGLILTVDGTVESRKSGRTGDINNSWPLSIGGKTNCDQVEVGCDYYAGDIDYVQIEARA